MSVVVRCPGCLTALPAGARGCAACGLRFELAGTGRTRWLALTCASALVAVAAWWLRGRVGSTDGDRSQGGDVAPAHSPAAAPPSAPFDDGAAAPGSKSSPPIAEPSAPAADDRALAELARAALSLQTRDAGGIVLRAAWAFRVDPDSSDVVVAFAALNGAAAIARAATDRSEEATASEVAGLDGRSLALVGRLAPSELPSAAIAAAPTIGIGGSVYALHDERGARSFVPAGTMIAIDDRQGLVDLAATVACDQRWLADGSGRLLGLAQMDAAGTARLLLLQPALARLSRARPLRLEQVDATFFEQDGAARRERGTWYAAGGHYELALDNYVAALELEPRLREEIARPATACTRLALRDARLRDQVGELLASLERAAELLDREPLVLHACGLALLDQGEPERALAYLRDAANISGADQGELMDALRAGYLHAGEAARAARRPADAIATLEEGLLRFREDPLLLQSLGLAYFELGDRVRARIVLEKVVSLDESQQERLEPVLAALRPPQPVDAGDDAVEIRFAPGSGAIRAKARFSDRTDAAVLIDTGATITAIGEALADRLKIDRRRALRRVQITTASGKIEAPIVALESLDVQGARVTNVEAAILPLNEAGGAEALVGLNFLEHFSLSLDARRGVLRLTAKR